MRLLLVETEGRILPFARDLVTSFADCSSTAQAEPVAAVSWNADLVVLARDAWNDEDTELCRLLHAQRLPVPLLALSGPCEARQRIAALRAGGDDFLAVPFEVEELVARAFALVRRASSGSRYARVGAFQVNLARRQVIVGGVQVPLTPREYDLVAILVERAGEVVTRKELAGDMTPTVAGGDSNVVDVHMSRIRDKLGAHADAIETVRGLGYRLRQS